MAFVCAKCLAAGIGRTESSATVSRFLAPRVRRAFRSRSVAGPRALSLSASRLLQNSPVALVESLSPQQQEELRQAFRSAGSNGPNLGPFPRARLDSSISDAERRSFRELGATGKVARLGSKTFQWLFVAAGVGIAGLVGYSTLSELFARNSPTKLYEQATEKIQQNAEIRSILGDRLLFYGDHPSARKRRSHRVQHTLQPDSRTGRQIMTLTFFVESKVGEDVPWHVRARTWLRELVWEPSDRGSSPPLTVSSDAPRIPTSPIGKEAASPSWWSWLFGSFFSSLTLSWRSRLGEKKMKKPARPTKPSLGDYTTGEVIAILKQDTSGRFLFHSLTVDVPERGRDSYRVYVIKPQTVTRGRR